MAEESHYHTSADFYVHNREKCFIQMVSIATDIVGTFIGAFNAYKIQQLKSKFQEISNGHIMLVRVTQKHDVDIRQMKESLASIIDVIDLMAEYNPGLFSNFAKSEDFHNQAEKLLDYYQIEVTYSRTMDDIVLMVHVA
jgi:hypothetical protein